jgi:hypothetical protein
MDKFTDGKNNGKDEQERGMQQICTGVTAVIKQQWHGLQR